MVEHSVAGWKELIESLLNGKEMNRTVSMTSVRPVGNPMLRKPLGETGGVEPLLSLNYDRTLLTNPDENQEDKELK